MPVNSKKQSQGQRGKKGDDAKTKARKAPEKETIFGPNKKEATAKDSTSRLK
ncbi:MAG: hypothetical protein V4539_22680 [Bacteroidota bacterium]